MRNITIRVPEEDIEGLDEIAARQERDRSWIVRKIIREHLKKKRKEANGNAAHSADGTLSVPRV